MAKTTFKNNKSWQHPKDFPSGPPPQYYPGPATLNFGVLKRSGVFVAVWPPANIKVSGLALTLQLGRLWSMAWFSGPMTKGRFEGAFFLGSCWSIIGDILRTGDGARRLASFASQTPSGVPVLRMSPMIDQQLPRGAKPRERPIFDFSFLNIN